MTRTTTLDPVAAQRSSVVPQRGVGPGSSADAAPLDPARSLALRARVLERLISEPHRRPDRWAMPGFGTEVDLVRLHLGPIRTRAVLVASFGRESHHVVRPAERRPGVAAQSLAASPVEVAYAIRWLELSEETPRPGWTALLGGRR